MAKSSVRMRQLTDWGAAVWAGIIAGLVFLVLNLFLVPAIIGGNAWVILRLLASIILGQGILAPPATFHLPALLAALATHFVLAIGFALLLALIIHRWGLAVGIIGGAVFGLALYGINVYTLTYFFPWFFVMKGWPFLATHIVFGALAGGIYEGFEIEEFVPA